MRVDAELATPVPGLFVCGEAVGGANGANRLSGNGITEALAFGARAGRPERIARILGALLLHDDALQLADVEDRAVRAREEELLWLGTDQGFRRAEARRRRLVARRSGSGECI